MKRFVKFTSLAVFGAAVLSACGQSVNCNPASYAGGQLPTSCYATGTNPYGTGYPTTGYPTYPTQGYPGAYPPVGYPGYPAQPPYGGGGVWVGGGYVAGGGVVYGPNPYGYPCAGNPYCYSHF